MKLHIFYNIHIKILFRIECGQCFFVLFSFSYKNAAGENFWLELQIECSHWNHILVCKIWIEMYKVDFCKIIVQNAQKYVLPQ